MRMNVEAARDARVIGRGAGVMLLGVLLAGCAAPPPPRVIHESPALSVRLEKDSRAESPHEHPARLKAARLVRILSGARLLKPGAVPADIRAGKGAEGSQRAADPIGGGPALSGEESRSMAPFLAEALAAAAPDELVTFTLKSGDTADPASRLLVTSGGLFIQDGLLYLVLANVRTHPVGDPLEGSLIAEMDIRTNPLLPITPGGYGLGFVPSVAWVQSAQAARTWRYVDSRKILVIDLGKLPE